ncbi:MAG: acireductone synthase [Gemmataceae bacterium]
MILFSGKGILLDIEGTTSSVSYVFDVLFPYAREHVTEFLSQQWDAPETQAACEQIAKDAGAPSLPEWVGESFPTEARAKVVAEVHRLMDGDVKATGLKELQGLIWKDGFLGGQLRSHVFDDVPDRLKTWNEKGLDVRIYSSGSITAQKLFFGHTEHGDLLSCFQGHYDTTTGPKKEAASYTKIAQAMDLPPNEILFCSDIVAELDAAKEAGFQTVLLLRPENKPVEEGHGHRSVESFEEIHFSETGPTSSS